MKRNPNTRFTGISEESENFGARKGSRTPRRRLKTGPFNELARRDSRDGADLNQRSEQRSHLEAVVKLREAPVKGASMSDREAQLLPRSFREVS